MAIGTATALIGGSLLAGGLGYLGARKQSKAVDRATSAQTRSSNYAAALQREFLEKNRQDIASAVRAGLVDLDTGFNMAIREMQPFTNVGALNRARQYLADPSRVMDDPGVQFQYEQGIDALQAAFSRSSGGGLSGPAIQAAEEFGQNFAATQFDRVLQRLAPFIDLEYNAAGNIAELQSGRGKSKANLRLGGATRTAAITGDAGRTISSIQIGKGQNVAAGQINRGNIAANLYSNIGNTITDLASLYAIKPGLFNSPNTAWTDANYGYNPAIMG